MQPLLKAGCNVGCVVISGDQTKCSKFRLIIKCLVHFIDVVAPEHLSGLLIIIISLFLRKLLIARKHFLCIVKSRDAIRPTGLQRSRIYGLPITHKESTPLRPILSMSGSSHHELGKWLIVILQPVLEQFLSHCISHSFTFAKIMQNLYSDPNVFMCSFDVCSLFTNVPLDETIKICSEALYDESDSRPIIPKDVLVELMKNATSSVEFSFNNTMHEQTDGVAM